MSISEHLLFVSSKKEFTKQRHPVSQIFRAENCKSVLTYLPYLMNIYAKINDTIFTLRKICTKMIAILYPPTRQ